MSHYATEVCKCPVNLEKFASIPKSGLEIKNRCTLDGVSGQKHAVIPKSGPEIKNRCTLEGLNGESMHRRWIDSGGKSGGWCARRRHFPMFLPPRGRSTRPKSRHAQQSVATAADETSRHAQRPSPQHCLQHLPTPRSTKKEDDRGHPPVVLRESARIGPLG